MWKRWIALALVAVSCLLPGLAFAATPSASGSLQYWDTKALRLSLEKSGKELVFSTAGKKTVIGKDTSGLLDFFVTGNTAVYYGQNEKGKLRWFTYDTKTNTKKDYAYDFLSPFWADGKGVYTTTSGKRTYDYNVYRFTPGNGKKTKIASVYGMPIGYVQDQLVALDFYHKEIRYYKGDALQTSIKADILSGFVVGGTVYVSSKDGMYVVDGKKLRRVGDYANKLPIGLNDVVLVCNEHSGGKVSSKLVSASRVTDFKTVDESKTAEMIESAISKVKQYK